MEQKILVIDDSDPIHSLVKVRFKHDPIEIVSAHDGKSGIGLSATVMPDLILLDVDMPDLDGFEVCRRLKEDPATSHIPVVFLTSESKIEQKVRGLALGAEDYVTKPFDGQELRARINSSLRKTKTRDAMASRIMIDPLTNLWNGAYLQSRLTADSAAAPRRRKRSMSCIVVDVDHLKSINARFGRAAGDDVLRALAERIVRQCRAEDTVSRLNGGTFAVLSPDTAGSQAVRFASRLWLSVQTRPVIYRNQSVNFKCSYGVACLESPDGAALMEEAHRALLHAKNIGGTRVATSQQSINTDARSVSFSAQ